MDTQTIRLEVDNFRKLECADRSPEDAFAAWYLKHKFGLSPVQALMQTSDPAIVGPTRSDSGLDGFHLELDAEGNLRLILIQAKFTESMSLISRGLRDLERALRPVESILSGSGCGEVQNKIFVNLRAAVQQHKAKATEQYFSPAFLLQVIHLKQQESHVINANCRRAIEDLKEQFRTIFPNNECTIELPGPDQISGTERVMPVDWLDLHLTAVPLLVDVGDRPVTMYSGIGHLADMVDLYNLRRDNLFEKNVRYYLRSKRNLERGPAGKMRDTLKEMCLSPGADAPSPELFAFYHNGITLFAREVRTVENDGTMQVREPFVLNGCQTIKTGFLFRHDARLGNRIDEDIWRRVKVPIRIITTRNEDLIRQITIANNRQNQISASALRANDSIQVDLADRFKRSGIFYQRQEGAFEELEESNPAEIETNYGSTNGDYVDIEDLARCLAATAGEFDLAHSPSRIFENDKAYGSCFSRRRCSSIRLLTFLQNMHIVLSTVLTRDLELRAEGTGPKPSRLIYYAMCLLMRYLAKTQDHDFILDWGGEIVRRRDLIREQLAKQLDNYHSGIKRALRDKFLRLEDARAESMKTAFRQAANTLSLRDNIDPFEEFAALDEIEDEQSR